MQNKSELNESSHDNNGSLGTNSIFKNDSSENLVALPLPSKNQHIGKKIVSKLLIESENVVSKTQFNARPKNDDDDTMISRDLDDDFDEVCLFSIFSYIHTYIYMWIC